MKLDVKDITILCKGEQLKKLILEKYHSLDNFLEQNKISLYSNSIVSYLNKKEIPSQKFKRILENIFEKKYDELFLSEEQQIQQYVESIYDNIDLYVDKANQEVIEHLRQICIKKSLWLSASKLYRILSIQSHNVNNLPLAVECIKIAIDFAEYQKDNNLLITYVFDLLCLYSFRGEYNSMLEASKKIEKILSNIADKNNHWFFLLYYYQGQAYTHMKNYDTALKLYNKALNYTSNNFDISRVFLFIASLYMLQSDYFLASEYTMKALSLLLTNSSESLSIAYAYMSEIEKQSNNYDKSLESIKKAIAFTDSNLGIFFTLPYIELLILKKEYEAALNELKASVNKLSATSNNQIFSEDTILYIFLAAQLCFKYNCYDIILPVKLQLTSYLLQALQKNISPTDLEASFIGYLQAAEDNIYMVKDLAAYPFNYVLLDYTEAYGNNKYKPHIIYKYY